VGLSDLPLDIFSAVSVMSRFEYECAVVIAEASKRL